MAAKKRIELNRRTESVVLTALMISLVLVGTILLRIPVPMTQGYVHLGDAMIYLGVLLLGRRNGIIAASVGSALGDIIGGYGFWAPWSLVIKGLMALTVAVVIGASVRDSSLSRRIIAMTAGGAVMCAGYFAAESVIYGSMASAAIAVPWNAAQAAVGILISLLIAGRLEKGMNIS